MLPTMSRDFLAFPDCGESPAYPSHVCGQGRAELTVGAGLRMCEPKALGVQHLPSQKLFQQRCCMGIPLFPPASLRAVKRISHHRAPLMRQMDSDLVGPAGQKPNAKMGEFASPPL